MKVIPASDAPQRSEAWQKLHIGRPTASMFAEICTPATLEYSKGKGAKTAMYRLAAERLLGQSFGRSLDGLQWIEVGKSQEPMAVQQYEVLEEVRTFLVSFIMTDDQRVGCSPDALVVDDLAHGIEIKSLFAPKMVRLHTEGVDNEHRVQVLGQMWIGEMEINDYFAYNEAMPPFLKRWRLTDVRTDVEKVRGHVLRFCDDLDKCVDKMNATGFFTKRERPQTPLDEMAEQFDRYVMGLDRIEDIDRWLVQNAEGLEILDKDQRERVTGAAQYRRAFLAASTP